MTAVLITIGVIAVFAFIEAVFALGIMAGSSDESKKNILIIPLLLRHATRPMLLNPAFSRC